MSVEASFIDSLLAVSGDSDGSGEAVSDADSAAQGSDAAPGGQEPGGSGTAAVSSSNTQTGSASTSTAAGSPESGKQADAKLVETPPAKTADDPVTQIGRLNGALREVRGENKDLKQQLSAYSAQLTAMQEQIKALAQPKQAPAEEEAEPDFLADPKVYVDKNLAKAKQEAAKAQEAVKKLEDGETQRAEQAKKQAEMQEQWSEVLTKEQDFAADTPDYHSAINYIRDLSTKAFFAEYEAVNDRPPTNAEISKALTTQEIQGALTLQQKGKNPAQWYYAYAKSLGYKTPEAPAADPVAAAPPAKAPAAKPDKEAVKSMGSGGSSGPTADPEDANRDPMAGLLGQVHGEMTAKRKARKA